MCLAPAQAYRKSLYRQSQLMPERLYLKHVHLDGGLELLDISLTGIVLSGRRPLIKGFFAALRLIVGAVMSSAC
jgi:hypothetical protein